MRKECLDFMIHIIKSVDQGKDNKESVFLGAGTGDWQVPVRRQGVGKGRRDGENLAT